MDNTNTEEKNAQPCTPDEACCCDTAAEQAPVTAEMIEEAYNRLEELVNHSKTPVILHLLMKDEDTGNMKSRISTCKTVTKASGSEGAVWVAVRGYLAAAGACFSGNPKVISQGVKFAFTNLN